MRRAVAALFGAIALLLVAVPSWATEEPASEATEHATEEAHDETVEEHEGADAFGEGQWDGLLAAAAVAAVFGLIVFALSNIGVKDEPAEDAHH